VRRGVAAGLLVLLCLPGIVMHMWVVHKSVTSVTAPPLLERGEDRALNALREDRRKGTVLAPRPITLLVPGLAHREVWSSGLGWTPDWANRAVAIDELLAGELVPAEARALVRRSGARFLLSDCRPHRADLRADLAPLLRDVHEFGCARVYEVDLAGAG
jgi:hypothetical protein